jgi:hypothetical protein
MEISSQLISPYFQLNQKHKDGDIAEAEVPVHICVRFLALTLIAVFIAKSVRATKERNQSRHQKEAIR